MTSATGVAPDAALPFPSAGAGLMLMLAPAMSADALDVLLDKHWRMQLGPPGSGRVRVSRLFWTPHAGCQRILRAAARRGFRSSTTSWLT